jgi:hypothetical protein
MPDIVKTIDSAEKGDPKTGYEDPDGKGPFNCQNCEYYSDGSCGQPDMMRDSPASRKRVDRGRIKVDALGCCKYVDRVGNKYAESDSDEDDSPGKQIMTMGRR